MNALHYSVAIIVNCQIRVDIQCNVVILVRALCVVVDAPINLTVHYACYVFT